ncbi:MAG: hypothetical protein IPJ03_15680 [Ignavibacteriales bacterium]|nr:hypothetical protein [Ignavibacteriales bacterium]
MRSTDNFRETVSPDYHLGIDCFSIKKRSWQDKQTIQQPQSLRTKIDLNSVVIKTF